MMKRLILAALVSLVFTPTVFADPQMRDMHSTFTDPETCYEVDVDCNCWGPSQYISCPKVGAYEEKSQQNEPKCLADSPQSAKNLGGPQLGGPNAPAAPKQVTPAELVDAGQGTNS